MTDSPADSDRPDVTEFELERAYDREELAAVFREFADAFDAGRPIRLDGDEQMVSLAVPRGVVAEFEAERDADSEPPVGELEIDLEWDDPDGSSVRIADRDADDRAASDDDRGDRSDATDVSPAAAVMSPADVAGRGGREDEPPGSATEGEDEPAAVQSTGSETTDDDRPDDDGRRSRFEVYEDTAGEWRWRLVHWNGNIVADSGEGYVSRSNAERAARSVMRSAATATVERRGER
ncbi:amphi-Trp domain-containing protein [Natrinema sp. 74]|uniref:amphi-Trp domain-containing protein n=1 Tax=Natrinema sp. 74 TaxID=3384159 RepID=UPI0038D4FD04